MDAYLRDKKPSSGLISSKRASGFSPKDASSSRDQNVPVCSRVGCSSRVSLSSRTPTGVSNKTKSMKQHLMLSTSDKETTGSSSRQPPPSLVGSRNLCSDHRRKLPSHHSTDFQSNIGVNKRSHLPGLAPTAKNARTRLGTLPTADASGLSKSQKSSSSSLTTLGRIGKTASEKSEQSDHATTGSSSSSTFSTFRHGSIRARNACSTNQLETKNVKCSSMSNGAQSGCSSSSESSQGSLREVGRKRNSDIQSSSSAKEKKGSGAMVDDRRINISNRSGISISDSTRARNSPPSIRDSSSSRGISSSVSRQAATVRSLLNAREDRHRLHRTDSSIWRLSSSSQHDTTPHGVNGPVSRYRFGTQSSSSRTNTSGRPGSSTESIRSSGRSSIASEVEFGRSSTTRDNLRTYNLDGITEMLLALDRMERNEHLTYEQLLLLETSLILGDISFHDRHRDMRLDIDNMTYEELLALEDKMGSVSTALTEEALGKCLQKSIFHGSSPTDADESNERDGAADLIKCSICQEEYADGNELGKLGCQHMYHLECITHWLGLKNWCPVCKASAQQPPPPPPPSLTLS